MKVTRVEMTPPRPQVHEPYEVRIALETADEARLFWALMCHNLTVPNALVKAEYLDEDQRKEMEKFMQQICAGVRSK